MKFNLDGLSPEKRAEAAEVIAEYYERNPLLRYEPHPKQAAFHAAHHRTKLFVGGNRCLDGAEVVRMADGSAKAIRDVRVGERVFGCDLDGNPRPAAVLAVHENGRKPIYRWRFRKRESEVTLLATREHNVAVRHEKWDANRSVSLEHIGQERTRSRFSAQLGLGYNVLPVREEERHGMLLGLLLGDGYTVNHRPAFTTAEPEIAVLLSGQLAPLGSAVASHPANPIQYRITRPVTTGVCNLLAEYGLDCYAHEKRIPDQCWSWSNVGLADLVAGLLLTDGSVWEASEGWRVGFTSVSRELARDLHRILRERFGVYGSRLLHQKRDDKNRAEFSFTIGNYESLRRLSEAIPLVGRKAQLLAGAVEGWEGKRSDASRLRFVDAEYVGEAETYDLTVDHPDHHFLLASGLVVHNSGKTTAGIVDDIIQAVDKDFLPERLKPFKKWEPPFKCRIVSKEFTETMTEVIFDDIRSWVPRDQLLGGSWEKAYQKQARKLMFENGSTFSFMTYEQDLDNFRGWSGHRVHFDEEPEGELGERLYIENWKRLTDHRGDFLLTMTPEHGMSWVYERFAEPIETHELEPGIYDNGTVFMAQVDLMENPHVGEDEKAEMLAVMTEEEKAVAKSGTFLHFAGVVYSEWDEDVHACPVVTPQFLEDKTIYVGIDPGLNKTAVVFCAFDSDNDMLVFDELYLSDPDSLPEKVVEKIREKEAQWLVKPSYYLIDPAARIRNQVNAEQVQTAYIRAGLAVWPAQNAVEPGITEIKRRMQKDPPAFAVARNCQNWRWERKRYRRRRREDGTFEVVKKDDHLLDATRYVAMARPIAPPISPKHPSKRQWVPGTAPPWTGKRTSEAPPLGVYS